MWMMREDIQKSKWKKEETLIYESRFGFGFGFGG